MKAFVQILLLLLPALVSAQAEVIARETFDYAPLNPLFCIGDTTGGFLGAWTREIGDDAIVRRGNLREAAEGSPVSHRGSLEFVRAGIRYNRPITRIQDDGDELWLAVDMDFRPGSVANNVANVTLTRAGNQAIAIGRKFGNRKIGLVFPGAGGYNTEIDAEGLHHLVLRIRFSGDTGNDEAWLWVDPTEFNDAGEPTDDSADLFVGTDANPALRLNIGIDGVQLKNEGTPPLFVDYDNLILARSFAATDPDFMVSTAAPARLNLPLTVFPNPATGPVTVSWDMPVADALGMKVYDANGRLVIGRGAWYYPAGRQSVVLADDLNDLPAGTYVLQLSSANYRGTTRMVIGNRP